MGDIISTGKLITELGIMVTICAIFLYTCIRLINIGIAKVQNRLQDKDHDELLNLRSEIDEKVQVAIQSFLEQFKCDRIQVIEFGNSVKSVAYLPFKYMTCTYEVYKLGDVALAQKIDRLSTSLFTPFFSELYKSHSCIFDIHSKDKLVGGAMYDLMKDQNISQLLCVLLKSPTGKCIGYISLQKNDGFSEELIDKFESLSDQVTTYLTVADK